MAITYCDGRISYRELDELSDGLAVHLVEHGVGRGDRLALYPQNVPQFRWWRPSASGSATWWTRRTTCSGFTVRPRAASGGRRVKNP
ncbi:AMP-binding protein [Saccharopolyspora hattusasensis]|uniref:AMP-binding protein n=1 Tax=Saccharopolyspora hattusasensis TaxID=1128679 RepID=UPI003D96AE50